MRIVILLFISIQLTGQSVCWHTSTKDIPYKFQRSILEEYAFEKRMAKLDETRVMPFIEKPESFRLSQVSYFLGAGALSTLNESESFNGFRVSAELVLNLIPAIKIGQSAISFPFRGNTLGFLEENHEFGVYPVMTFADLNPNFDFAVHGGFERKTETIDDILIKRYRYFFGPEIMAHTNENPLVLSPVIIFETQGNIGAEATLIFEIAPGMGAVARGYLPFRGTRQAGIQFGTIIYTNKNVN